MKLIFCRYCDDVVKLSRVLTSCKCGKSQGRYLEDGIHAEINMVAVPIGMANSTVAKGVVAYIRGNESMDCPVDAWVFKVNEPHIERVETFGEEDDV